MLRPAEHGLLWGSVASQLGTGAPCLVEVFKGKKKGLCKFDICRRVALRPCRLLLGRKTCHPVPGRNAKRSCEWNGLIVLYLDSERSATLSPCWSKFKVYFRVLHVECRQRSHGHKAHVRAGHLRRKAAPLPRLPRCDLTKSRSRKASRSSWSATRLRGGHAKQVKGIALLFKPHI